MMDDSYRSALAGGLTHVFRQLLDVAEERDLPVIETGSDILVCSALQIRGDWPGRMVLRTTENLCATLISILFPQVPISRMATEDVVCELLNMVSESSRTLLSQRKVSFEVGPPSLVYPIPEILPEDDRIVRLEFLEEPIELWF